MDALNMDGGIVSYLKNPGNKKSTALWEAREVGRFPSMHRLKTGHFTQKEHLEIIALPIMLKTSDRQSPAPMIIYTPTKFDDDGAPSQWVESRANNDNFRLIHDVEILHSETGGLDKVLIASREGISLLWFDEKAVSPGGPANWYHENLGLGLPQSRKPFQNPYWGSGSVATGRVGKDRVAYIATCEAFHGNLLAVWVKPPTTRPDELVTRERWRRFVIDDFGPLKTNEFTGTVHNVYCADLDGSGVDTIVVACMGYLENIGTYIYRPIDLQRGLFARIKISDKSAGRIAVADFRCSGTLDIATISYSVPNYLETKDPGLRVLINNNKQTQCAIKAQRLDEEVLIRVPRAPDALYISELPFLDIAGKKLSIVVLPPHKQYVLGGGFKYQNKDYEGDGIKVINGELHWTGESDGRSHKRGIAIAAQQAASLLPDAKDNIVRAGKLGAIFVRLASSTATAMPGLDITDMADVATVNCLPFAIDQTTRDMVFPWVRCNDRPWAKGRPNPFDDSFYNLVGYHVVYDDDSLTSFCHIQAWTLGSYKTAEFHNHSDKTFCEIHACIVNGTGQGGMWWARDEPANSDDHLGQNPAELDPTNLNTFANAVYVDSMHEHGPLWRMNPNSPDYPKFRDNGTVEYPYHAWIAGPWPRTSSEPPEGTAETYDCWLAFEFPPTEFQHGIPKYHGCAASC
ncbi:hypothetical protein FRC11_012400 [Ceratobasidium sp. 423]|nr:hypothetical protein FRC11_012400 [Ceratobasidium sp. 423]